MTTEQSKDFMKTPYGAQRESSWKELKDMILPAIIMAAAGTLAYKGFNKMKGMTPLVNLPQKLSREQEALLNFKDMVKASSVKAETDIPYQTAKKFEEWMKGARNV